MSEERLELIKENVYMRSEIATISGIGIDTSLKEELELILEIDRLNNIINELEISLEVKNERIKEEQQEKERYIKFYNGLNIWNKDLQQKVEQLENIRKEATEYMKEFIFEPLLINEDRKLIMFNENLKNFENILNKGSK